MGETVGTRGQLVAAYTSANEEGIPTLELDPGKSMYFLGISS